jgi:hypothetical protein
MGPVLMQILKEVSGLLIFLRKNIWVCVCVTYPTLNGFVFVYHIECVYIYNIQ